MFKLKGEWILFYSFNWTGFTGLVGFFYIPVSVCPHRESLRQGGWG
jgi:hypothetical protein